MFNYIVSDGVPFLAFKYLYFVDEDIFIILFSYYYYSD